MSREIDFKPYLLLILVICVITCIFSYKIAAGLILGTVYFFISDKLNQRKFPKLDSKGIAVANVFLIIFIQFILILGVALVSYYIGGLYSFLVSFAGITFPHAYFIIVELMKGKK